MVLIGAVTVTLAGCGTGVPAPSASSPAQSGAPSVDASPRPSATQMPTSHAAPASGLIRVSDFVVPFTYRLPSGETVELSRSGYPDSPAVIYSRKAVSYGQDAGSTAIQVFLVTGSVHSCGPSMTPNSAGAVSSQSTRLKTDPEAFMEGLRDRAGVSMGLITETTLGNLPAVTADLGPPGSCAETLMHENGLGIGWQSKEPAVKYPGRLIIGRAGARAIGVLITASTETGLAAWLPIAQAYVDSFVFDNVEG